MADKTKQESALEALERLRRGHGHPSVQALTRPITPKESKKTSNAGDQGKGAGGTKAHVELATDCDMYGHLRKKQEMSSG